MLALFSPAYFERPRYTTEEWTAALVHVPETGQGRLVPVRVENLPAYRFAGAYEMAWWVDSEHM